MKWNFMGIILGPPEWGKTSVLRALARRHLQQFENGLVFLHDPVGQFAKDGCVFYKDVAAYRAAQRKWHEDTNPSKAKFPRGASVGGDDVPLIRLAIEMGKRAGNTQTHVRLPIFVGFDEASLKSKSGSTWIGDDDNEIMVARRHFGIGLAFNAQDGSNLMKRFFKLCTDVYLLAQTEEDVLRIEKQLILEKGSLIRAGATKLQMHQYLHVRHRVGVVAEKY